MSKQLQLSTAANSAAHASRIWNGQAFEADLWQLLPESDSISTGSFKLISLARWRAEKSTLETTELMAVGLLLSPNDDIDPQVDEIHRLALIVLPFPKFTDGRSYSTARRLREQWGYINELRATGDVLIDQIPLMTRCGFTSFEIKDPATLRILERSGTTRMSRMYQSPAHHGNLCSSTASSQVLAAAQ